MLACSRTSGCRHISNVDIGRPEQSPSALRVEQVASVQANDLFGLQGAMHLSLITACQMTALERYSLDHLRSHGPGISSRVPDAHVSHSSKRSQHPLLLV